jgi:hypothetical protein
VLLDVSEEDPAGSCVAITRLKFSIGNFESTGTKPPPMITMASTCTPLGKRCCSR